MSNGTPVCRYDMPVHAGSDALISRIRQEVAITYRTVGT
jgi:hypothetical protein